MFIFQFFYHVIQFLDSARTTQAATADGTTQNRTHQESTPSDGSEGHEGNELRSVLVYSIFTPFLKKKC